MDSLKEAITRTVEDAVERRGVICVSDEAKRLAALYPSEAQSIAEVGAALTREGLRSGVGVRIGEPVAPVPAADDRPTTDEAAGLR